MGEKRPLGVWFPTVRAGTGTDVFTVRLVERLKRRGIRADIEWLPLSSEYAFWKVRRLRMPEWADLLHVNTWFPSGALPLDVPIVATIHHSMHHPGVRAHKDFARHLYHRYWLAPNERRIILRAACVCAVSEFVAQSARQSLADVPMTVVYNGVDVDEDVQRRTSGSNPFQLLYAGAWRTLKGVDLLAPIMSELGRGFELLYTGNSPGRVEGNMRDIGRLAGSREVAKAMQHADALLFPSRSEGFPLVVIEAMANGLPVIATKGSSMPEAIEDGVNGILCPQDDVGLFVNACHRLAADPDLHHRMSQAGRARAKQVFSLDRMVDTYFSLYSSCLEGHNPGSGGRRT